METESNYRFLVVEDHLIVAIGLERILKQTFFNAAIDIVSTGKEAIGAISKQQYSAVILDIRMEDNESTALLELMLIKQPKLKILVFSQNPEKLYARPFIGKGAKGYLSKQSEPAQIVEAVRTILDGNVYMSQQMKNQMAVEFRSKPDAHNPLLQLSHREVEVLNLLIHGHSPGEVSKMLNLHTSTVGTYKGKIFEKLNVSNIIELKEFVKLHQPEL